MKLKKEYIHSGRNKLTNMKYEMKIQYDKKKDLKNVIEKSYFEDNNGKLKGKKHHLKIDKKDPIYLMLKGLNNMTIRLTNEDLIDGCVRFVVDEQDNHINLFPCSIYCIIENEKYSFY
jgi:hypothetical protein